MTIFKSHLSRGQIPRTGEWILGFWQSFSKFGWLTYFRTSFPFCCHYTFLYRQIPSTKTYSFRKSAHSKKKNNHIFSLKYVFSNIHPTKTLNLRTQLRSKYFSSEEIPIEQSKFLIFSFIQIPMKFRIKFRRNLRINTNYVGKRFVLKINFGGKKCQ